MAAEFIATNFIPISDGSSLNDSIVGAFIISNLVATEFGIIYSASSDNLEAIETQASQNRLRVNSRNTAFAGLAGIGVIGSNQLWITNRPDGSNVQAIKNGQ